MILNYLCPPALLYAVIMLIYLVLELSNEKYHQAFVKAIVGIIFTCILQAFCQMNLGLISWIFVMIPIIFYTYITLLTFFIFGVNPDKELKNDSPAPSPAPPPKPKSKDVDPEKWLASKHVSSTPITTSLYTPSLVPAGSFFPKKNSSNSTDTNNSTPTSENTPTSKNTPYSGFSYSQPNSSVVNTTNKVVPVSTCTRQTTSSMCNSLSVCAWTGSDCINTSEFQTRINDLDISCSLLSDSSCNYLDECYLLTVSDKSVCLPSIPSIGKLFNDSDCKTLLNQMKYDSSTNVKLSTSIDKNGCSSIANRIYSLLV